MAMEYAFVYCFDSVGKCGKCKIIVGNVENVVLLPAILRCSHVAHVTLGHLRRKRQDTTVSLAFAINIPLHLRHFLLQYLNNDLA